MLFSPPEAKNFGVFGCFSYKICTYNLYKCGGKAADARTYTYFPNLINKIQRLTQASQRRQKWRFFLPFLQKNGEFRNFRSFLNGFCTYIANKLLEKAATALPIEGGYWRKPRRAARNTLCIVSPAGGGNFLRFLVLSGWFLQLESLQRGGKSNWRMK